jgi:type II secretory pathway predicted ATPase ExeA
LAVVRAFLDRAGAAIGLEERWNRGETAWSSARGEMGYRPEGSSSDAREEIGRLVTSNAGSAAFDFIDPFGSSADPARYVPRTATERALEGLVRAVRDERRSAVLSGIPGIGKTLLLRLLARYLAPELRAVHIPYASMPAAALCAWAMELLGGRSSYDPVGAVVAHARRPHADGAGLVLLIDDAQAMPAESAPQLARAARESGGALRLVGAVAEATAGRLLEAWDDAEHVILRETMDLDETSRYVAAHLEAAGLPEVARAAFDTAAISELHRRSGGVPGRVNPEASLLLRRVLARAAEQPAEAEEGEAAFERAAGRLALAHSELAFEGSGEQDAAAFERAAGRLTLARLEIEPVETRLVGTEPLQTGPGVGDEPPETEPLAEGEPPAEGEPLVSEPPCATDGPPEGAEAEAPAVAEASAGAQAALPAPGTAQPDAAELRAAREPGAPRGSSLVGWLIVFGVFFAVGGGAGIWLGQRRLAEMQPAASLPAAPSPSGAAEAPPATAAVEEATPALTPAPAAAPVSVQINANPWATILVDGEEVGITPLAGVPLGPGPHRFEARFPDGQVVERVVEIDEVNRFVVFP